MVCPVMAEGLLFVQPVGNALGNRLEYAIVRPNGSPERAAPVRGMREQRLARWADRANEWIVPAKHNQYRLEAEKSEATAQARTILRFKFFGTHPLCNPLSEQGLRHRCLASTRKL